MYKKITFYLVVGGLLLIKPLANHAQLPTNNDPNNQIRFNTIKGAEEKRKELINFIWNEKLPIDLMPNVIFNKTSDVLEGHFKYVNKKLVKRIDKLEVEVLGLTSTAYSIIPEKSRYISEMVLFHAGHGPLEDNYLKKKYCSVLEFFLEQGYNVIMLNMPMIGWNDDNTAILPNGKELTLKYDWSELHKQIVLLPELDQSMAKGAGFRPFLEPVVACINYWKKQSGVDLNITMIGLSGGGWTTHMMAAIDRRIKLSFPVAGSYPLYLRNGEENKAHFGDLEQYYEPLFNEDIAADGTGGGIATWMEIYALGGAGTNRKQIMITSQYDDCCFFGDPKKTVNTFKAIVKEKVEKLGFGDWKHELDTTHREHTISPWMIETIVKPNLSAAN